MSSSEYLLETLNVQDSWRLFRIMAEVVEGFETLNSTQHCVSIFGSARVTSDSPVYKETETIARLLVENGFGVITGGGPGLMEAGNKGAFEAGAEGRGHGAAAGLILFSNHAHIFPVRCPPWRENRESGARPERAQRCKGVCPPARFPV